MIAHTNFDGINLNSSIVEFSIGGNLATTIDGDDIVEVEYISPNVYVHLSSRKDARYFNNADATNMGLVNVYALIELFRDAVVTQKTL